jgi:hypothetical protein
MKILLEIPLIPLIVPAMMSPLRIPFLSQNSGNWAAQERVFGREEGININNNENNFDISSVN